MTNTRITDPEILEKRYPVILRRFCLRKDSGGKGKFKGGDGVIRQLLFRRPVTLSVITERRVFSPYGIKGSFVVWLVAFRTMCVECNNSFPFCHFSGGSPGSRGTNLLFTTSGKTIYLGPKTAVNVEPGVSGKSIIKYSPCSESIIHWMFFFC